MAEIRCPHCGGSKYELISDSICKCSYCKSTFTYLILQNEENVLQKEKQHFLTIRWKGMFLLYDAKIYLNVNGVCYDDAYIKKGFSITVPLESSMTITLSYAFSSRTFNFSLNPDSDYEMYLNYRGWFDSYDLVKKASGNIPPMVSRSIDAVQSKENSNRGKRNLGITILLFLVFIYLLLSFIYLMLFITFF